MLQIDVISDVRERLQADSDNVRCNGFFFEHDGQLFGLGAESGTLYVILAGELLAYDDTLKTQLAESPENNTFTAMLGERQLCRIEYTPLRASGWIPNEDDECLDGFLWMHNVLQSPERCSIMIANGG